VQLIDCEFGASHSPARQGRKGGLQAEDRVMVRRMTAFIDTRSGRIAKRSEVPMLVAASASPNERGARQC
jgi:hypothetical protein